MWVGFPSRYVQATALLCAVQAFGASAFAQQLVVRSRWKPEDRTGFIANPTSDLAKFVGLSVEQLKYIQARWEEYHKAVGDIVGREQDICESYPAWERLNELDPESQSVVMQEIEDRVRPLRHKFVVCENDFFREAAGVISESQLAAFRSTRLRVDRQAWFGSGNARPQDFLQLADPVPIAENYLPLLADHEGQLATFKQLVGAFEDEMEEGASRWALNRIEARLDYHIALAAHDAEKAESRRKHLVSVWLDMYNKHAALLSALSSQLSGVGHPECEREMFEAYWAVTFPELMGAEITPHLFDSIDFNAIAPELATSFRSIQEDYLSRRFQLIQSAIAAHINDLRRAAPDPITGYGITSKRVWRLQVDRCELALNTRKTLASVVPETSSEAEQKSRSMTLSSAKRLGYVLFDTLQNLKNLRSYFQDDATAPDTQ